jgi:hypothetical protein
LAKFLEATRRAKCRWDPPSLMVEQYWYTGAAQAILDRADTLDAKGQTAEAIELDFALLRLALTIPAILVISGLMKLVGARSVFHEAK